jgi:hypothetical protein
MSNRDRGIVIEALQYPVIGVIKFLGAVSCEGYEGGSSWKEKN